MVHDTFVNRVRVFVVVFALVAVAATIGIFFSKREEAGCRRLELSGANLSKFFQVPSSKASIFLTAIYPTYKNTGQEAPLVWDEEYHFRNNMQLSEEGTQIMVVEKGFYLVFAQATFKVPNLGETRENLMLRVDVQHPEQTDQYSAVFATHCGTQSCGSGESDVVLNKPILLWLEPRNNLTVVTRPWQLVDYAKQPASTFLTVFKYSD
ncbi:hypothetical protein ANANG_G00192180 [Anguilla anguilla]|uniref:THD domain-containing protein n=1 Tax=Anguilla anguilla TaxID=7936 RepID=A0A9D3M1C0_ANGAN|nr:hypothetical protein ANANG_G00192180 [Anguilla anguilla]